MYAAHPEVAEGGHAGRRREGTASRDRHAARRGGLAAPGERVRALCPRSVVGKSREEGQEGGSLPLSLCRRLRLAVAVQGRRRTLVPRTAATTGQVQSAPVNGKDADYTIQSRPGRNQR